MLELLIYSPFPAQMCQCTPHIWLYFDRCEDLGLEEITPGTNSFDAECGRKIQIHLIAGILVAVVVIVFAVAGVFIFKIRHKKGPCTGKFHINPSIVFYLAFKCLLFLNGKLW